jgi:hypothetical protein
LRRRLAVIGICVAVAAGTVVAVQRSTGPDATAVSRADGSAPVLESSSGLPTLEASKAPEPSGNSSEPDSQVPARPADALDDLLDARAKAIRDGDRAAWLGGLAPASDARVTRFRTAQGQVFSRIRSLRPAAWSYQVAGGFPLPADRRAALGGVGWLADVQLDYQLVMGGPTVRRQQFLTIVRGAGDRWLIADDTDGSTGRDVWDLGPIVHAVSARCLVVGALARQAQVEQFAAECGRSARIVDAAWGRSWPRRTVLTVPDTRAQLGLLLGRSPAQPAGSASTSAPDGGVDTAGLEKTAAVTIGPSDAAADTVLINGSAFAELSAVGRRVVLTHELVHVATRASGSWSAPVWLAEGYADYVAYADTGLSAEEVAGEALAAVRAGGVPAALPGADDFNAAGDQAAAAYGLAWVATALIADRNPEAQRLRDFYRQAAAPGAGAAGLDAALAAFGLGGTASFVKVWQARLRQLAE